MVVDGGFICDAATFFWLELGCSLLVVSSLVPVAAAADTADDDEDGVNGCCASFGATDLRTDGAGMPDDRVGIPVGVFLAVFEAC